jgi:hypothetical protein
MNGDFSRITFNPLKFFTSVVLQQGRVQTDADANEQAAILLHYLRSLAAHLIGPHGGPADVFTAAGLLTTRNSGFAIIAHNKEGGADNFFPSANDLTTDEQTNLRALTDRIMLHITSGAYYVDGLLCENDSHRRYWEQPYFVRPEDELGDLDDGLYLFYLDVWERLITALEEPSIREVALGGADTAARTKLIWQVKILPRNNLITAGTNCANFNDIWPEIRKGIEPEIRGRLKAMGKPSDGASEDNVCITSPEARYRGIENQLYRVEVHRGGPAMDNTGANRSVAATFKWSSDNGTVTATIKRKEGDRLIVSGLRDLSRWFSTGNWVEITHDALELNNIPGTLVQLAAVDREILTIDPYTTSGTIFEPTSEFNDVPVSNLKVRRWDHKQPEDDLLEDGAIPIEEGKWIELEDGVQVFFEAATPAANYRTGDYWLIPARVATGDVEWPKTLVPDTRDSTKLVEDPQFIPSHGVTHHYAPLAIVTVNGGDATDVEDLRHKFPAAAVC